MSRNSLLEAGAISEVQVTATRFEPTTNWTNWAIWLNGCVFVYELSGCGFKSGCSHLKGYNVMISGQNFINQQVKNNLRTYDSI